MIAYFAAILDNPFSLLLPGSVTEMPVFSSPFLITTAFNALVKATPTKLTVELSKPPIKVPSLPFIKGATPLRIAVAIAIAQLTAILYDTSDSLSVVYEDAFLLP